MPRLPGARRSRFVLLPAVALALALALTAHAAVDRETRLRVARDARERVGRGQAASLWSQFDERMRAALKDSVSFAAMSAGIDAQLGPLDSLLDEEVLERDSLLVLRSRARFSKAGIPIVVTVGVDTAGRIGTLNARPDQGQPREAPSAYLEYQPKARFQLPFRGEWLCFWGGRTVAENYHAAVRSQRFAYDLVMVKDGTTHKADGKALTDYHCYGQPILAPSAGTVVTVVDTLPDQAIGSRDPSNAAGNHVVIDHGNQEFSLLAHLQPRSLKVRVGQNVKAGDVLGLTGNSGNTSEPHLHVHLMNAPSMKDADGLPMPFDDYLADGVLVQRGEPKRMQKIQRTGR